MQALGDKCRDYAAQIQQYYVNIAKGKPAVQAGAAAAAK